MFSLIRWIPLLILTGLAGTVSALCWYCRLSAEDRGRADRIAEGYASDLFDKARWQLSSTEAKHVHRLTREHFIN
jgi:hypothetical protein